VAASRSSQKLTTTVLPPLAVKRSGNSGLLSWPAEVGGAQLEPTDTLDTTVVWDAVLSSLVVIGNE